MSRGNEKRISNHANKNVTMETRARIKLNVAHLQLELQWNSSTLEVAHLHLNSNINTFIIIQVYYNASLV